MKSISSGRAAILAFLEASESMVDSCQPPANRRWHGMHERWAQFTLVDLDGRSGILPTSKIPVLAHLRFSVLAWCALLLRLGFKSWGNFAEA